MPVVLALHTPSCPPPFTSPESAVACKSLQVHRVLPMVTDGLGSQSALFATEMASSSVTERLKGTTTFPGSGACANTNAGRQAMSKSSKNFDMIDSLHTKAGSGWPQPTNNVLE